ANCGSAESFRVQMVPGKGQQMTLSRKSLIRAGIVAGFASLASGLFTPVLAASDNAASKWKVWTYNPSNRAFKGSVPATASGSAVATFPFPPTPDTALLVTDHGSYKDTLLGDLTGKTI